MTVATKHIPEPRPERPSTLRVRRHRERRSHGLRLLTVTVPETVIEAAVARGLLASEERAEPWAVISRLLCFATFGRRSRPARQWRSYHARTTRQRGGNSSQHQQVAGALSLKGSKALHASKWRE